MSSPIPVILKRPASWLREMVRFVVLHAPGDARWAARHRATARPAVADRVVVSLTTIPDRIDRIRPTLLSLLDQTRRPDAIVLNLPDHAHREQRHYEIPPFLDHLDAVERVACGEDRGPATKILPTLERELDPDTRIIVLDDDQVYPRNLVETLVAWSERLPDAAVGSRGFAIPAGFDIANRDTIYGTHVDEPRRVEIMQGSAGFLVRRRFFDERVFDYSTAPPEAFFVDDVWLAGHLARAGVDRYVVPFDNCFSRVASWSARRSLSLWTRENASGTNDAVLYRYFEDAWKDVDR
jgi:hypothetical protein